jgi:hypothetical protein
MTPRRPTLEWDDVVEYAFLADFDLLRESREDIQDRPWTKPACRVAMDQYFKQQRAAEEIERLNIEIARVVTFLEDESAFLLRREAEVAKHSPLIAHQITCYRLQQGRFHDIHMRRFRKLALMQGFTGTLQPGVSVDRT